MQLRDIAPKTGPQSTSPDVPQFSLSTKMTTPTVQTTSESASLPPTAVIRKVYVNADYSSRNSKIFTTNSALYRSIYTTHLETATCSLPTAGGLQSFSTNMKTNVEENFTAAAPVEFPTEISHESDKQHISFQMPVFVVLISLLEIAIFLYNYITVNTQRDELLNGSISVPSESVLVYRPDRRLEIWRFVSYMVLHANWYHLSFNITVQLLFGVPLEMTHGSVRIAVIYMAGVFAGSLGTSIVDSAAYLVGASGGVYALLSAQLANMLLNFSKLRYGTLQYSSFLIFVFCDLSHVIYTRLLVKEITESVASVSYIAHMTGILAGFTMGLLVLKHFDPETKSTLIWWLALIIYMAFTVFAITFNLFNTITAQKLEEEGQLMKKHLLDTLGIS